MAGNKGRGRAAYTFNIEAVGFSRGEKLPDAVLKPSPLFPDTDYKPVPVKTGEGEDYMLALKQELRETMKRMPYFIETPEEKQDIERYSKRYMKVYKEEWIPDWRRLPREMMPRKKCKKAFPPSLFLITWLWQNRAQHTGNWIEHFWLGDMGVPSFPSLPLTCQLASPPITCFLFHSLYFPLAFELCVGKKHERVTYLKHISSKNLSVFLLLLYMYFLNAFYFSVSC
ncbi:DNA-directed RNA polymerase III subunit RPC7 isoform 1-T2 [Hipposideros larvatus]